MLFPNQCWKPEQGTTFSTLLLERNPDELCSVNSPHTEWEAQRVQQCWGRNMTELLQWVWKQITCCSAKYPLFLQSVDKDIVYMGRHPKLHTPHPEALQACKDCRNAPLLCHTQKVRLPLAIGQKDISIFPQWWVKCWNTHSCNDDVIYQFNINNTRNQPSNLSVTGVPPPSK